MVTKKIDRLLYFSSSEVYGSPDKKNIPTSENYNGNVSTTGPRACYDEAKGFVKHFVQPTTLNLDYQLE